MDIFRIFDANNWLPNIKLGIDAVLKTNAICEAAICYTGDILDPKRDKYTLNYFVNLAKELEKLGTHFLAIKDMAGLLKPYAAKKLVKALREAVGVPIHFHTHDSAGGQIASYLLAAEEGVDIVDCAFAPLAGVTSQPSLNALVEAMRFTDRDTGLDFDALARNRELLGRGAAAVRAVRDGAARQFRGGLSARDARRAVREPLPAGAVARRRRPLARSRPHVRRGQQAVRRHREGDADLEGRRRHDAVHARQQPDRRRWCSTRSARSRSRNRWSSSSRGNSASRRAASRRRCRHASSAAASR